MGRIAMQMLLNILSGVDSKSSIKVEGELVIRESIAPPSREGVNTQLMQTKFRLIVRGFLPPA